MKPNATWFDRTQGGGSLSVVQEVALTSLHLIHLDVWVWVPNMVRWSLGIYNLWAPLYLPPNLPSVWCVANWRRPRLDAKAVDFDSKIDRCGQEKHTQFCKIKINGALIFLDCNMLQQNQANCVAGAKIVLFGWTNCRGVFPKFEFFSAFGLVSNCRVWYIRNCISHGTMAARHEHTSNTIKFAKFTELLVFDHYWSKPKNTPCLFISQN